MQLEGGRWTALCGEHGLEMFDRVQQWISLCAGRRRLFAAKPRAPVVQPPAQSATEAIHRLQRKRQAQLVRRRLEGKTGQPFQEPGPHQRRRERVPRQNLRQENGKRAPATSAPPAIGTKHPLSAHPLRPGVGGIVAAQRKLCRFSVSTWPQRGQRCALREKACPSALARRAQNEKAGGTSRLVARRTRPTSSFLTALHGGTQFREVQEKEGRRSTALHPYCHRKLARACDANPVQKRHFLRRHCGT